MHRDTAIDTPNSEETFELPEIQTHDDSDASGELASLVAHGQPPLLGVRPRRRSRAPFAAAAATALLVGAMVVTLVRGAGAEPSAAPAPPVTTTEATEPFTDDASVETIPTLEPLADGDELPPLPDPESEDIPLPPPDPDLPDLPPPAPVTGPSLSVTEHYTLDPGVHATSVALTNDGEDDLQYEIVNDGDGFDATSNETGTIEPGGVVDVWIELDVVAEGDGPTPFSRTIEVESNGGNTTITIEGQVEKPGFLVAEFESIPLVDYRATLRFTNVGELPVELTGGEAPGLTLVPLPDSIAGGETLEVDVAICAGADLPVFFATPIPPNPLPMFHFASWVTLETAAGSATTSVAGTSIGFFPPSCEAIDPGVGDITLGFDDGIDE